MVLERPADSPTYEMAYTMTSDGEKTLGLGPSFPTKQTPHDMSLHRFSYYTRGVRVIAGEKTA